MATLKKLAENYSEFNAYWSYIYKQFNTKEDDTSIKVRASLIAMRNSFRVCVDGLSKLAAGVDAHKPVYTVVSEGMLYSANMRPQLDVIKGEQRELLSLVSTSPQLTRRAVELMGDAIGEIDKCFSSLRTG